MKCHLCNAPNCTELVPQGKKYCNKHRNYNVMFNKEGKEYDGVSQQPPYSKDWPMVKQKYLKKFPNCERCGQPATQVHHLDDDYEDNSNLQQLCNKCHNKVNSKRQQLKRCEQQEQDATSSSH